jgi:NAD(P)H-dependent FMN reductase
MKITIIAGSPRHESLSARVALHVEKYLATQFPTHTYTLVDVRKYNLPFVQNVFTSLENTPTEWKPLAEIVFSSDAFVLVSPEYNGSYSPAMKNLLDHFPKYSRKTFGIVTSSPGAMGGMRAAQQMLQLIAGISGIACPTMLIVPAVDKKFAENGDLLDESFTKNVSVFANEFVSLAEAIAKK